METKKKTKMGEEVDRRLGTMAKRMMCCMSKRKRKVEVFHDEHGLMQLPSLQTKERPRDESKRTAESLHQARA